MNTEQDKCTLCYECYDVLNVSLYLCHLNYLSCNVHPAIYSIDIVDRLLVGSTKCDQSSTAAIMLGRYGV